MIEMTTTYRAVSLVNEAEGVIEGYVHIWNKPGERDAYNTWFDKERPPEMALDFVPFPLHHEHAMDGRIRKDIIGKIVRVWFDDIGVRFEGRLYRDKPYFSRLIALIRAGKLFTSSATSPHVAEFDDEKRFVHWELSEVSLTENPAEKRIPAVSLIRSEQGQDAPGATSTRNDQSYSNEVTMPDETPTPPVQEEEDPNKPRADVNAIISQLLQEGYTIDELMAVIGQMQQAAANPTAMTSAPQGDFAAQARSLLKQKRAQQSGQPTEVDLLRAENELLKRQRNAPPVPQPPRGAHTPTTTPQIRNVLDRKFDHMSGSDMAFAYDVLRSAKAPVSPEFSRAMALKTAQAAEKGDAIAGHYAVRSAWPYQHMRADEVMAADTAGAGDEWVGVFYSTTLWEKARVKRVYEQLIARGMMELEVPQGHESVFVPTEGADPTWYTTFQADDVDSTNRPEVTVKTSTAGTGRVSVTPGEISAAVMYNQVLEEDSLIAMAPQLARQMQESAGDTIEYVMLNADSDGTASTNINLIDGTPGTGLSTPRYMVTDGILKLALVTNTANSRDGGVLDENDYLDTIAMLPDELAADFTKLLFLTDVRTNLASKKIATVKTKDVYTNATIENGQLTGMWGVDIAVSGQMGLANTAGKISATPGNNTKGRIAVVVPMYWALVWKRRVETKTGEDILGNVKYIVSRMRIAMKFRTNEASAVSYNLTV